MMSLIYYQMSNKKSISPYNLITKSFDSLGNKWRMRQTEPMMIRWRRIFMEVRLHNELCNGREGSTS